MNDDGRAILRQGDVLAQLGDAAGAAARYLDYCAQLEKGDDDRPSPSTALRTAAVRKQVLALIPELRDVRRQLVESYACLGLLDEARAELRRLATEWDDDANTAARDEVVARLDALG